MTHHPDPRIVYAKRLDGDLLVEFEDGKCALYSAALLHELYPKADKLIPLDPPDAAGQ